MLNRKRGRRHGRSDLKQRVAIMKRTCLHAYLATVDGKQPVVRSVSPIVDRDGSVWIATFAASRKVKHIKSNPRVCLEFVGQPSGEQLVTIIGSARIAPGRREREIAWRLARYDLADYFPDGPGSKNLCLLRIVPSRIEWRSSWTGKMKVCLPRRRRIEPRKTHRVSTLPSVSSVPSVVGSIPG